MQAKNAFSSHLLAAWVGVRNANHRYLLQQIFVLFFVLSIVFSLSILLFRTIAAQELPTQDLEISTTETVSLQPTFMLIAPIGLPGSDPTHLTPVLRYAFTGTGGLTPLSTIPASPNSFVNDPIAAAVDAKGELFIANRHGNVGGGVGSIARFVFDAAGNFSATGVITGNGLEAVTSIAFSPSGELFAANLFNRQISRFRFDSNRKAIANGTIDLSGVFLDGTFLMGLAFAPAGELFVTHSSNFISRYRFDPVTGNATLRGTFSIPGASRLHFLDFSQQGELFVADPDTDRVYRYKFDNSSNPIANGTIPSSGGALGIAFSPIGELFVSKHFTGGIDRFLFNANGVALPNGSITTDSLGDVAITTLRAAITTPHLVLGSTTAGSVANLNTSVNFADEDLLLFDQTDNSWFKYFDGSDVGLSANDVDAFAMYNHTLLLSLELSATLPVLGEVHPNDIIRFAPTSLGESTRGTFSWFLDGSDVGLGAASEDIDSIGFAPDGRLLVSTGGSYNVNTGTLTGQDEDILVLNNPTFGSASRGTWQLYFDGSDVNLLDSGEDVRGISYSAGSNDLYLSTRGLFNVTGLSGDSSDVFICRPSTLGDTTACTFSLFFDGSANGFGTESIDGLQVNNLAQTVAVTTADADDKSVDDPNADDHAEEVEEEVEETDETDESLWLHQSYLPMMAR